MGESTANLTEAYFETLVWAAEFGLHNGYSVIPVHADSASERAKVAAIHWKPYQYRRATQADVHRWFKVERHRGLAVVTGAISNLVVLDFDDVALAQTFANRHPHLTETYTARSARRGLPHYYYRLAVGAQVATQKRRGVDLLSNGCYVIAPPTVMDGNAYGVIRGGAVKVLTNAEIDLILRFLDEQHKDTAKSPKQAENRQIQPIAASVMAELAACESAAYRPDSLRALYQRLAPLMGRNEALFRVSVQARDTGWTQQMVVDALVVSHIEQPASTEVVETAEQRLQEGLRTIASAFSRPPGQKCATNTTDVHKRADVQLPTSARESLLACGQTHTLRVIEGLYLQGLAPGRLFTEKQARILLGGIVGRYSLLKALEALSPDGTPIFAHFNPSPRPPTPTSVASNTQGATNNKCFIVNAPKPDKNRRGRPAKFYRLPTISEVCTLFGVAAKGSDCIDAADLRSAKGYRQAIHREFLKRRPGMYARTWLAQRLGVSIRTCQRYNVAMAIGVRPMYYETTITWANLALIPDDFPPDGAFLQDRWGKCYPVNRGIAAKLLARDRYFTYKQRDVNYYWVGESPPVASVALGIRPDWLEIEAKEAKKRDFVQRNLQRAVERFEQKMQIHSATLSSDPDKPAIVPKPPSDNTYPPSETILERYIQKRKSYYRQPLSDTRQEMVAMRAYRLLAALGRADSGRMSKAGARRLVERFGARLVADALHILGARRNVRNPAGFLVTVVRSEAKMGGRDPVLGI